MALEAVFSESRAAQPGLQPSMYSFPAPITMGNASASLADCIRAIDGGETEFALDGLGRSDSSAVAVLLAAARHAREKGVQPLRLTGMSEAVASLAKLYGVDALLSGREPVPTIPT